MSFFLAQGFAFIAMIFGIVSFQAKSMKQVLICQLGANSFTMLNYALLGGISGAGISIAAIVQSVIIFFINKKGKKTPSLLVWGFALTYVAISAISFKAMVDILPGIAAVAFSVSLTQKNPAGYRWCMLANVLLWIGYDVSVAAYMSIVGRIVLLVSIVSAMIRYDFKRK